MGSEVVLPYMPREAYAGFHAAGQRWTQLVAHRRSGKTFSMLAEGVARALAGPKGARYYYVAPFYSQAKAIAWDILKYLSFPVMHGKSEVELWVKLMNGSQVRLYGADRPDALRGLPCHGLMADEYADWMPYVYEEILEPMLADTLGWGVFGGTPKGRNHFFEQREIALADPTWHTELLPVSLTQLIDADELIRLQASMSPEVYAQEFECSFVAPRSGSYYGQLMEQAMAEGRVGDFPHQEGEPVYMAADLGFTDSTACWYWQEGPEGWRIIDYDEWDGQPLSWWISLWGAKGYEYKTLWLPHDARAKSLQTGRSTIEQVLAADLPAKICPNLGVQDGIEATRMMMPKWYFNENTTAQGRNRMANYRRRWNPKTHSYSHQPLHDANSHGADGARYMALVQKRRPPRPVDAMPITTGANKTFQLDVLFQDREQHRGRLRQRRVD